MKTIEEISAAHCLNYSHSTGMDVPCWVGMLIEEACREVHSEALEEAAGYMDRRAGECEASMGGGPTQGMMARIFRDEAKSIRALGNE